MTIHNTIHHGFVKTIAKNFNFIPFVIEYLIYGTINYYFVTICAKILKHYHLIRYSLIIITLAFAIAVISIRLNIPDGPKACAEPILCFTQFIPNIYAIILVLTWIIVRKNIEN